MSFEQRVGNGWRCDGCGKIAPWGKGWRSFGTIAEQDDGLLRWVSCSKACADASPPDLRDLEIPKATISIELEYSPEPDKIVDWVRSA